MKKITLIIISLFFSLTAADKAAIKCAALTLENAPTLLNACKACDLPEGCTSSNCGAVGPNGSQCKMAEAMIQGCPSDWLDVVIQQQYLTNLQKSMTYYFGLQRIAQTQTANCWNAASGSQIAFTADTANQYLESSDVYSGIKSLTSGSTAKNAMFCSHGTPGSKKYSTQWWVDTNSMNMYATESKGSCENSAGSNNPCIPLDCTEAGTYALYPTTCTAIFRGVTKSENNYNLISYLWLTYLELGLNNKVAETFKKIFFDPNFNQIFPNQGNSNVSQLDNIANMIGASNQSLELSLLSDTAPDSLPAPVNFATYYQYYTASQNTDKLQNLIKAGSLGNCGSGTKADNTCANWESNCKPGNCKIAYNCLQSLGKAFNSYIFVPSSCPTNMGVTASSTGSSLPPVMDKIVKNVKASIGNSMSDCQSKFKQLQQTNPGLAAQMAQQKQLIDNLQNSNNKLLNIYDVENKAFMALGAIQMVQEIGCAFNATKGACEAIGRAVKRAITPITENINKALTWVKQGASKVSTAVADVLSDTAETIGAAARAAASGAADLIDSLAIFLGIARTGGAAIESAIGGVEASAEAGAEATADTILTITEIVLE